MIDKYVGQIVEIIYLDRNGHISQRKIEVWSIKDSSVKAYCLENRAPRIFMIENILAIIPTRKRVG